MDLEIRRLSEKLVATLNENPLPIEIKRLVLKDIYLQVESKAQEIIEQEKAEEQKKEESEK